MNDLGLTFGEAIEFWRIVTGKELLLNTVCFICHKTFRSKYCVGICGECGGTGSDG